MIDKIQANADLIQVICSIVQAIGVIISLIYVTLQVRSSTKSVESQTHQTIISSYAEIEARISRDNETARIFKLGCEKPEDLNDDELERFRQLVYSIFKFYENLYYQYKKGLLEESFWNGWCLRMRAGLERPGVLNYWAKSCYLYSDDFFEYVMSKKCPKIKKKINEEEAKVIKQKYRETKEITSQDIETLLLL